MAPKTSEPKQRFLRRFTVQNIRTFRTPATIDFCLEDGSVAQWTVILGENGTGKTSLLQYLAGMMPVQDPQLRIPENPKGKQKNIPPFRPMIGGQEWFGWNAGNVPRPWTKPAVLHTELSVSIPAAALKDAVADQMYEKGLQLTLTFEQTPEALPKITTSFTVSADIEFFSQVRVFGYGASRHVAGPASPYLSSDSFFRNGGRSPVDTLFHDDHPLISPEQWLLSLDHISRSGGEAAKHAKRSSENARRCLANVLPGISSIDVRPFGILERETVMTVVCETPYGLVPFSALSLGYRTMAAWLTDFVKRMHEAYPSLGHPNHGPAVVIIDEFDLHMHPAWQRDAMRSLSQEFPNTQFIVTDHSPLVVQAVEGHAKLAVLRRVHHKDGSEEVIIDSDPQFAAGWRVDQILASDLYNMSPRSPSYTKLMEERVALRQKAALNPEERRKLKEIEEHLDKEAPPGLTGSSSELLERLKLALQLPEKKAEK